MHLKFRDEGVGRVRTIKAGTWFHIKDPLIDIVSVSTSVWVLVVFCDPRPPLGPL